MIFFFPDFKINMRLPQDPTMHNISVPNTVQLGPPSPRGVQIWSSSVPGGLLVLAAGGWSASGAATASHGAVEPAGSCGGLESSSYIEG